MRTKLARYVLHTAFGIGVCAATATLAPAQAPYYPPRSGYAAPGSACPYPTVPSTAVPGVPGAPLPSGAPLSAPPAAAPSGQPSTSQQPSTPQQPQRPEQPEQPQAQQQQNIAPEAAAAASTAAAPTGAEAGLGGGGAESSGGFLGRGDADNRFNLFDNNSAFPTNRVWFTYEFMQNFQTGVRLGLPPSVSDPAVQRAFGQPRDVNLYRMGGEFKLGDRVSIAVQDEYVASTDTENAADAWANPEFMLKWAFILEQNNAVALTLGLQPQVASHDGELHEKDTRFLPGILAYQGSDSGLFFQEGAQFGLSSANVATTFDWAFMIGYWLCRAQCSEGNRPFVTGFAPQLEVFGKHVMVGSQNQPFEIPSTGFSSPASPFDRGAPFREDRNVIDVTAGARILLRDTISISSGVSFPVTGGDVRRTEYLANITFLF